MNQQTIRQIRRWTAFIMFAIVISGLTAFPIETELKWLDGYSGSLPDKLAGWIHRVLSGVRETNSSFPFLAYATDWLAFAHLVIALVFIGVWKDPVRNQWIVNWAILCCILVFPLAFIAGPIRGIPFFHQLIDCSFGAFGLIPLLIIRNKIKTLERSPG